MHEAMGRRFRSATEIYWALGLLVAALPFRALATPYGPFARAVPQTSRAPTGPTAVPGPPVRDEDEILTQAMPGADAATRGDSGATVASGASTATSAVPAATPDAGGPATPDEDAITTAGLPGADAATRGDATAGVASGAAADAQKEAFRPWEVGGFIDANYSFNSNLPDNHVNRLRSAVPRTGEFSLNLAVAYIRRDPIPGQFSPTFELALQAGPAADALMYYEPTPGGDASRFAGMEVFKHIGRANIGFKSRRGTEVSVGMHLSPIGIGIHWTPFNWNYTVSWELDGVPYYLAGLKLVHTINDRHGLQLWVVNGWQTLTDSNKAPSVMLGYTFTPSPRFNLATFAYAGPDQADIRLAAWRLYSDTQFTYNGDRFGIGGLFDIGSERLTDQPGQPITLWTTGALFTRWRVLGKHRTWDMAARPEVYWDRDGRIYGVANNLLLGATYTNAVRLTENLLVRLEYRYDHSALARGYFYRGPAIEDDAPRLGRHQHAVYFAVAGVFAHRFGRTRK
jgi:hypothetical protein